MDAPTGLPENRATAWAALAEGATYAEAAEAAGVAKGTISKWIRAWRTEYGDSLFRDEAAAARAEKTEAAREGAERTWTHMRTVERVNAGITSTRIRAQLLAMLETAGTRRVDRGPKGKDRPIVVAGPSGADIKNMTDAYAKAIEVAELLDDRPTRHLRRSLDPEQYVPPALGPGPELSDEERRAKVVDLAARLRARKAEKAEKDAAAGRQTEAEG